MDNIIVVALLVLLILSVFIGLIVGASRGAKRALLRLITLIAAFILALLFTPMITKMVAKPLLENYSDLLSIPAEFLDIIMSNFNSFGGVASIVLNPIVFISVFIVFWLLSLIVYWILSATVGKRKKDDTGKKAPKRALIGMIIGIICGFTMFFPTFVMLDGYLVTIQKIDNGLVDSGEKSFLDDYDGDEIFAGLKIEFSDYHDNGFIKTLRFLDVSKACFNQLTTQKIGKHKVVLNDEIDTFLDAYAQFNALDDKNYFDDVDALVNLGDTILKSKIILVTAEPVIDYLLEHPDMINDLTGENKNEQQDENSQNLLLTAKENDNQEDDKQETKKSQGIDSLFSDSEYITTVLTEIKATGLKAQFDACIDVLRTVNDMQLSLTDLDLDSVSSLSDENIEKLIGAILDVVIIREMLPYATVDLLQPLADTMEIETEFVRPKLSNADWNNEKSVVVSIFRSVNALKGFTEIKSEDGSSSIGDMETYFADKANMTSLSNLMFGLRDSKLVNQFYGSLTSFNTQKDEYVFISYLDDMLFNSTENIQTATAEPEAPQTIRALFKQEGAVKTGGVSPNDNIDFNRFNWNQMFNGISDMFVFMNNVKAIENTTFDNMDKEVVLNALENIQNMDKEMLENVLTTIVPKDSNISIPNLDGVDMAKETEIAKELFDYHDTYTQKSEAGESMEREEIEDIVSKVAESDFLLEMLATSNSTIDTTEQEKGWIDEMLANSDYSDAKKNAIKNLFRPNTQTPAEPTE